ncbi:unnamed protein product [Caenorhabditis sp. 36 PRJEB53466]|nr:unnamed protein product [Caenorhabditis sp. 36 PRJEB53466]
MLSEWNMGISKPIVDEPPMELRFAITKYTAKAEVELREKTKEHERALATIAELEKQVYEKGARIVELSAAEGLRHELEAEKNELRKAKKRIRQLEEEKAEEKWKREKEVRMLTDNVEKGKYEVDLLVKERHKLLTSNEELEDRNARLEEIKDKDHLMGLLEVERSRVADYRSKWRTATKQLDGRIPMDERLMPWRQCQICRVKYDDEEHVPKMLSCGHTLCLQCVNGVTSSTIRKICPFDKTHKMPDVDELKNLPTNYKIEKKLRVIDEKIKALEEEENSKLKMRFEEMMNLLLETDATIKKLNMRNEELSQGRGREQDKL